MCTWRKRVFILFAQHVHELLGVLGNGLRNLGTTGGDLLKNRLKHRGVLLDYLTQLPEIVVAAKAREV
jgi:hypothetical protein